MILFNKERMKEYKRIVYSLSFREIPTVFSLREILYGYKGFQYFDFIILS
jgi:hypothetical protein